jgi:sulfatase modifying factor 1
MVHLEGGSFRMGSESFYSEEGPVHDVEVAPFEMDRYAVTNRDFRAFVDAIGYVTTAEHPLDPADFAGVVPDDDRPGSLVFAPTAGPVDLADWRQWWRWVPGADWRHPRGPDSTIDGLEDHPVVQVSFRDALAYAEWAGKRMPTEAEWEYAARGGLDGATFAWGEEPNGPERLWANTWQGNFPYRNTGAAGWVGTAPVGSFPPNGYGLYEVTGNTWEWSSDFWVDHHTSRGTACGCSPERYRAASVAPDEATPRRVLKGGSHLCAPEYCLRYRPAARSPESEDSATTHIGFRCAR